MMMLAGPRRAAARGGACLGAALLAAMLAGGAPPVAAQAQAPVVLRGAGATFPAPLYYKWAETFGKERRDVIVHYDSVGSGDGVARFAAAAVDFGASDSGISGKDAERVAAGVLLVPGTSGMVALAYNLPGLGGTLRLPRDVYVDIFLGRINRWDDPRLQKANPDLKLPKRNIAVVARLDRSGTTFAFTNHLGSVSEAWKSGPGIGTGIEWPHKVMLARGNEGVASRIKISEGSIGYVEYGFARRLGLPMAELENKAGKFVAASEAGGQRALAEAVGEDAQSVRLTVPDPTRADAYPIVTYTWLLLYKQYPDGRKRAALKDFVTWGLTEGQRLSGDLGFIRLPDNMVARALLSLETVR